MSSIKVTHEEEVLHHGDRFLLSEFSDGERSAWRARHLKDRLPSLCVIGCVPGLTSPKGRNAIERSVMIPLPQSNNYKDSGSCNPCVICGRAIKSKNPNYLHIHGGGIYVVTDDDVDSLDRSQDCGLHAIGPCCLKKHPQLKPYTHKLIR